MKAMSGLAVAGSAANETPFAARSTSYCASGLPGLDGKTYATDRKRVALGTGGCFACTATRLRRWQTRLQSGPTATLVTGARTSVNLGAIRQRNRRVGGLIVLPR
jgi:hypothetical protein